MDQKSEEWKIVIGQRLMSLHPDRSRLKFSQELGVSDSTVGNYERGDRFPDAQFLAQLRERFDVDLNWLLAPAHAGTAPAKVGMSVPMPSAVLVPRYDIQASAGKGALVVSENVAEQFAVGREWLRRHLPPWAPANAVVGILEGSGDSMEPTIRDGDLLMVVQDVSWEIVARGGIFVLSLDGRLLLKRLQVLRDGSLRIISDNPVYETELIPTAELEHAGLIIHGQVFFAGGKPRPYTPPQPQQQYFVPR